MEENPDNPGRRNFVKAATATAANLSLGNTMSPAAEEIQAGSPTEVIAETRYGKLRGLRQENGVQSFLGVPYATAERFRAPRPPKPWTGVRDATAFGPYCPQVSHEQAYPQPSRTEVPRMMPASGSKSSEDCLVLNVWTPERSGRRPVMVWLHGGAWTFGMSGGAEPPASSTNGDRLAATGEVVVVSVTHRIGVLGFCYLAELLGRDFAESGNAGVLDLVAALQWVRVNIAAFGGDPDNVTLFGYSGGGSKVSSLLTVPQAKGLFHHAGCISGHPHYCFSTTEATTMVVELLGELGLGPRDARKLLDAPLENIIQGTTAMLRRAGGLMGGGLGALKFAPVIDGLVFPRHPLDAIAAGASANIPLLATVTREEFNLQLVGDPRFGSFTQDDLLRRVGVFLGKDAPDVIAGYREQRPAASSTELISEIIGDHLMRLTTLEIVERHLPVATVPSYMGMFCWQSGSRGGALRACHGIDVPFIFGNLDRDVKLGAIDANAGTLMQRTRDAWIAFAKTGSPAHPGLPEWPAFDATRRATMLFNGECRVENDPLRIARRYNRALSPHPPIRST